MHEFGMQFERRWRDNKQSYMKHTNSILVYFECFYQDGFISHLTYLVQLPYLGISQNTKNDQFRRKQHIVLWINNVKQYFIYT